MRMNDFAEIVKKSGIAGKNKKKIIYQLLQVLGAKKACGESAIGRSDQISDQSPSDSTIQVWLSGKENPGVSRYFPSLKIENEKSAHEFLCKTPKEGQWRDLKELFKEWHNNNQNEDVNFCINTETDDFIIFSTSFWRQFVSFFDSLRMWDDVDKLNPETESNQKEIKGSIANEMIGIFKESFMEYRVYEFIPKEINDIIDSLYIYGNIPTCDSEQKFKKMFCKWVPNNDNFVFGEVGDRNGFYELKIQEECILLKFDESFDYDMMPTNTWLVGRLKYVSVSLDFLEDTQFEDATLLWKERECEIIIVDIDFPIDESAPIIEDYYMFIDEMLALAPLIDKFISAINEKILKKYENVASDYTSKLLYNDIKQYRKMLKKFKKNLVEFRNLQKEKSGYLNDQAIIKTFEMYSSFSDFEASPKPTYPFSECYLDQSEADGVISCLRHYHESLIELYAGIFSYEKDYAV